MQPLPQGGWRRRGQCVRDQAPCTLGEVMSGLPCHTAQQSLCCTFPLAFVVPAPLPAFPIYPARVARSGRLQQTSLQCLIAEFEVHLAAGYLETLPVRLACRCAQLRWSRSRSRQPRAEACAVPARSEWDQQPLPVVQPPCSPREFLGDLSGLLCFQITFICLAWVLLSQDRDLNSTG